MSQAKHTANLLWGAVALGALGVAGSYAAAGPERFWANWVMWFVLLFTLGLGALFIVAPGGLRKIQDFGGFFDTTTIVLCGDALADRATAVHAPVGAKPAGTGTGLLASRSLALPQRGGSVLDHGVRSC